MLNNLTKFFFTNKEFLSFFKIIRKNGIPKKGKFTIISKNPFPLPKPFVTFNKNRTYDSIILYFPSVFLTLHEISKLKNNLTAKGTLSIIDFMKKSKAGTIPDSIRFNNSMFNIKKFLVIEELRDNFRTFKYSVKKKSIGNYIWLFKISNEHLLKEPTHIDYDFTKYPFSKTYRNFLWELSLEILGNNLVDYKIIYDGNPIGNVKTYDFYSPQIIKNSNLFIIPFMYNTVDTKGNLKHILTKWGNSSNRLLIPIIKRNFLNNHFNCRWIKNIPNGILTFEAIQKIDSTFFLVENITQKEKLWEYHLLKYHNPKQLKMGLNKLENKNKMFNLYLLT